MTLLPFPRPAQSWDRSPAGSAPAPLLLALATLPLTVAWTLPQTLAGVALAAWARLRGYRGGWYPAAPGCG